MVVVIVVVEGVMIPAVIFALMGLLLALEVAVSSVIKEEER